MDSTSSTSPFESPIFEILAGESGNTKAFHAHASFLSKSKVLKTEVEGLWKESAEKTIRWPHWTGEAAEKFLEWLYTGDYKCPYPTPAPKHDSPPSPPVDMNEQAPGDPFSPATTGSRSEPSDVWIQKYPLPVTIPYCAATTPKSLQDLDWSGLRPLEKLSQAEEYDNWAGHQLWRPDELDYGITFMTHAHMYVMANHYMLDDLKNMAWQRLRTVLIGIGKPTPGSSVLKNLATLIHYTYQETGPPDSAQAEEPLRMLVASFAALHFTSLRGFGFKMLAAELHREFMVDLMERVSQHIVNLEGEEQDASPSRKPAKKKGCGKKVNYY